MRPGDKVYLAGPMRGIADFNFPAFHRAAHTLRVMGFEVWSPAERDEADHAIPSNLALRNAGHDWSEGTEPFAYYMAHDLKAVCQSDAVVCLEGWRESKGARLEVHVARECDIPVYELVREGDSFQRIDAQDEPTPEVSEYDPLTPELSREMMALAHGVEPDNPKKHAGAKKAPLHLVPPAGSIHEAEAFAQGADKYGAYNWREIPVDVMTYVGAMRRHLDAFADGEDCAPDSGVHHLGHIRACANIVLDCLGLGTLIDNRPVAGPAPTLLADRDNTRKEVA